MPDDKKPSGIIDTRINPEGPQFPPRPRGFTYAKEIEKEINKRIPAAPYVPTQADEAMDDSPEAKAMVFPATKDIASQPEPQIIPGRTRPSISPADRHDPWGDLIRGKKLPYMPYAGLDEAMARRLPVAAGPQAIATAPKYGISREDAASTDSAVRHRNYERLAQIQDTYLNGVKALIVIGTGTQYEQDKKISDYVNDLYAAGFQAAEMGESVVSAHYLKVAKLVENGENARTDAAKAFWISEFKSSLGSGETLFVEAAYDLLGPATVVQQPSVNEERKEISTYVRAKLSPGTSPSIGGMLQPDAIDGLIPYIEAETKYPQGYLDRVYSGAITNIDWRNAPGNPILPTIHAVRDYVTQIRRHELPENYRDLERWKAELDSDLEESAHIARVDIEGTESGYRITNPTKGIPIGPVRHFVQSVRRQTRPIEATTAAPLAYTGALSKVIAAATDVNIDDQERSRLLSEAYKNMQVPFSTIIGGDKPSQTWGDTFGKKGQSIAVVGEWFEKAGQILQKSADPNIQANGLAAQLWGQMIKNNAQSIAPWAETAAFLAPSVALEGPGAASPLGKLLGGAPGVSGLRTANQLANTYMLGASTPETSWPMLTVGGSRVIAPILRLPHLDQRTGSLMLPRFIADRAAVRVANEALIAAHPAPSMAADLWAMHKLATAGAEPTEQPPQEAKP